MKLSHVVAVGLTEGSLCLVCAEAPYHMEQEDGFNILRCYTCGDVQRYYFRRWRQLYPSVPTSKSRDVFASLEKHPTSQDVRAMYAIDVDTGNREDAERIHAKLQAEAGDVFDVYDSGNKGYHFELPFETWAYHGPEWPGVFRALGAHFDILGVVDTSIYRSNGLLRVPGSLNTKSLRHKTLLHRHTSEQLDERWYHVVKCAEEAAPTIEAGEGSLFEMLRGYMPPCIQYLWADGLPAPGTRHEATLHLLSYLVRRGDDEDTALAELRDFASYSDTNTRTSEAARLAEAERLVRHAYSHGLGFYCERAQDIGICEDTCKLHK